MVGDEPVPHVPHITGSYRIDGVLDDEIWSSALTFDLLIETNPRENVPAPVATRGYIVENGTTLLVAFDAKDPNPEQIRAYLRDRDSAFNDDFVGIVIDTFDDQRRAFEFFVNALGVQMDLIQDDVQRNEDDSWDAIWESAGTINDDGYTVEMAVPFSQLRFRRGAAEQTWALDMIRIYPREDRTLLSISPRERGRNCYLCQLPKIRGFANAEPGRNLEIVPSLTAARTDARDAASGQLQAGSTDEEVGVTISWGITPDVTANLALNPDFSQVEADVAQLDVNNQFSLFFPETRPFFLDGADYFATPINAVFTRTVADPDVGVKLTGRSPTSTYGVFLAEDAVTTLLFPGPLGSSNDLLEQSNRVFVGRYAHAFGENASTLGMLVTSRSGDDYRNELAGIDGRIRISDRHNVRFQYLESETEYPEEVASRFDQPHGVFDGDGLSIDYDFDTREWWVEAGFDKADPGFRADSGFVAQVGYEETGFGFGRTWHGDGERFWNQLRVGTYAERAEDAAGQLLERRHSIWFSFNGPLQSYFEIGRNDREQFWNGTLYDTDNAYVYGQFRPGGALYFSLNVNRGKQIDFANSRRADQLRVDPSLDLNVGRHMLLRLRHSLLQLDSEDGERIFDAQLSDARLTWQFNLRSFLRFTVQRQHVKRNLALFAAPDTHSHSLTMGSQLLYSYKVNPQTVFFIGYSDNYIDDDRYDDLTSTDRTYFVKLAYAWAP
ncbi:MAG TPA: carbohydrate binding family 9 domain-containing protein [Gammaproteobacteria bacterium]